MQVCASQFGAKPINMKSVNNRKLMTTIVFSHPWHGSFNKAVLDTITAKLTRQGEEFCVIDLNKDGFNPVFTEQELALYNKGAYTDPLVGKYQEILRSTKRLIIMFPVWWGTMPAILKGFFDKVMLVGFAYGYGEQGNLLPLLEIPESLVITTSQGPTEYFEGYMTGYFQDFFLASVGIGNPVWLNCDRTSLGPVEHRQDFLRRVEEAV